MTPLGFRFSSPSPPAPCSSLKPCWPALCVGLACKMAPPRMLMMLSRRAAWRAQKPSLCWDFLTKTRVFGTLARCAAPRRPGDGGTVRPPVAAAQQAIYGSSPSGPSEGACCAARFKSLRLRPPTPEAYGKEHYAYPAVRRAAHFCPRATAAGSLH